MSAQQSERFEFWMAVLRFWRKTEGPLGVAAGAGGKNPSNEVVEAEEVEARDGTKVKGLVGNAGLVM